MVYNFSPKDIAKLRNEIEKHQKDGSNNNPTENGNETAATPDSVDEKTDANPNNNTEKVATNGTSKLEAIGSSLKEQPQPIETATAAS